MEITTYSEFVTVMYNLTPSLQLLTYLKNISAMYKMVLCARLFRPCMKFVLYDWIAVEMCQPCIKWFSMTE